MVEGPSTIRPRGVIFDMDGTLIEQAIDFIGMRQAVGVERGDLLEVIASWGECERALAALETIARYEARAALEMALMPGVEALLAWLERHALERAIITRNNRATLERALELLQVEFSHALDRTFLPPKPSPDSLLHVARAWEVEPEAIWMVGDSRHDLHAARAAGIRCCLVAQPYNASYLHEADAVIERLDELIAILEAPPQR